MQAIEIELAGARDTLATKHDLVLLEVKIEGLRGDLRSEMHWIAASGLKQMYAAMLGQLAVLLGVAYFFMSYLPRWLSGGGVSGQAAACAGGGTRERSLRSQAPRLAMSRVTDRRCGGARHQHRVHQLSSDQLPLSQGVKGRCRSANERRVQHAKFGLLAVRCPRRHSEVLIIEVQFQTPCQIEFRVV